MRALETLADHLSEYDSTVVGRLNAAGALLLVRLNLTEGATGGCNPDFDVPLNRWSSERRAGTSSGQSGVTTALAFGAWHVLRTGHRRCDQSRRP
jgi:amidase